MRKPARWFHTVSADWFPGRFRFSPLIRESHLKAIFVSFVSHVDWVRQPRTRPHARLPKPAAKRAPIEINEIKVFSSFPIDQKQKLDFRGFSGEEGGGKVSATPGKETRDKRLLNPTGPAFDRWRGENDLHRAKPVKRTAIGRKKLSGINMGLN